MHVEIRLTHELERRLVSNSQTPHISFGFKCAFRIRLCARYVEGDEEKQGGQKQGRGKKKQGGMYRLTTTMFLVQLYTVCIVLYIVISTVSFFRF